MVLVVVVGGSSPYEAVLPEDVEELPGEWARHRPHLLLHDVGHSWHPRVLPHDACHSRHPQMNNLPLTKKISSGIAVHHDTLNKNLTELWWPKSMTCPTEPRIVGIRNTTGWRENKWRQTCVFTCFFFALLFVCKGCQHKRITPDAFESENFDALFLF